MKKTRTSKAKTLLKQFISEHDAERMAGLSRSRLRRLRLSGKGPKPAGKTVSSRRGKVTAVLYERGVFEEWLQRFRFELLIDSGLSPAAAALKLARQVNGNGVLRSSEAEISFPDFDRIPHDIFD